MVRHHLHDSRSGELQQRFARRRAGHVKPRRQRLLVKLVARRQPSVLDVGFKPFPKRITCSVAHLLMLLTNTYKATAYTQNQC
jgi:hypothetical protein